VGVATGCWRRPWRWAAVSCGVRCRGVTAAAGQGYDLVLAVGWWLLVLVVRRYDTGYDFVDVIIIIIIIIA